MPSPRATPFSETEPTGVKCQSATFVWADPSLWPWVIGSGWRLENQTHEAQWLRIWGWKWFIGKVLKRSSLSLRSLNLGCLTIPWCMGFGLVFRSIPCSFSALSLFCSVLHHDEADLYRLYFLNFHISTFPSVFSQWEVLGDNGGGCD